MATLIIYDKTGRELERHKCDNLMTWVKRNCPDFKEGVEVYSATLNGQEWSYDDHNKPLIDSDVVRLTIEPQAAAPAAVYYIYAAIVIASAAYSYYQTKKLKDLIPNQNFQDTDRDGESIYASNVQANKVVKSGIIREVSGAINIYPEYVVPPFRRYESNEEYLYVCLCIGAGYFDADITNVFIAETPIDRYSGEYDVEFFEPGDEMTLNMASEFWYQTKEIASTVMSSVDKSSKEGFSITTTSGTIKARYGGQDVEFPFVVGETFRLSYTGFSGVVKVDSIATDGLTASVIQQQRGQDFLDKIGVLDSITNTDGYKPPIYDPTYYVDDVATNLPVVTDEPVSWVGLNGGINWYGPFLVTPEGEQTDRIELDFFFRNGLTRVNDSGSRSDYTVVIAVEYREYGGTEWEEQKTFSFTGRTYDQLGYTVGIDFDQKITPEIRIRRMTPNSNISSIVDTVDLLRARTRIDNVRKFDNITTMCMRIRGSNSLAVTAENKVNIKGATRKLPTLTEIQSGIWDLRGIVTDNKPYYVTDQGSFLSSTQISQNALTVSSKVSIDHFDFTQCLILSGEQIKWGEVQTACGADFIENEFTQSTTIPVPDNGGLPGYSLASWSNTSPSIILLCRPDAIGGASVVYFNIVAQIEIGTVKTYAAPIDAIHCLSSTIFWIAQGSVIERHISASSYNSGLSSLSGSVDLTGDITGDPGISSFIIDRRFGRRMIVVFNNHYIGDYELTTPFDIGTAVLTSINTQYVNNAPVYASSTGYLFSLICPTTDGIENRIYATIGNESTDSRSTRSMVRFIAYHLRQAMGDKVNDFIDFNSFNDIDLLLDGRGDYLDMEFSDETTLWDMIRTAMAVGYCEPSIVDGKLTIVRTSTGSDVRQVYSPDMMLDDGLTIEEGFYDGAENGGVEVEYFDNESGSMEVVEALATGDNGLNLARINALGITSRTMAWRFGMRYRNQQRYKPAVYSFTTEMDALNSFYGDPIAVSSDLFSSQYGEVIMFNNVSLVLTLSFSPVFAAGTHYVGLRDSNGLMHYQECTQLTDNDIQLLSAPVFTPVYDEVTEPTLAVFGVDGGAYKRAIVTKIEPRGETTVNVTAQEYVEEIYSSDDASDGVYVLPNQVLNYGENKDDFFPSHNVGRPQWYAQSGRITDMRFGNGTKTSDDGFFNIWTTGDPSAYQIKLTAAGIASGANDAGVLPNYFIHTIQVNDPNFGWSSLQSVQLKVDEQVFPPVQTVAYYPFEEFDVIFSDELGIPKAFTRDYANQQLTLRNSDLVLGSNVESVTDLARFRKKYIGSSPYWESNFYEYPEVKSINSGVIWVLTDGSSGDVSIDFRIVAGVRPDGKQMAMNIKLNSANLIEYTDDQFQPGQTQIDATIIQPSTTGDYVLHAVYSDGVDYSYWNNEEGFKTVVVTGDLVLKGSWIADVFGGTYDATGGTMFMRPNTDAAFVSWGITDGVMSEAELQRLYEQLTETATGQTSQIYISDNLGLN